MYWIDLILICYPLLETHNALKYPRLKICKHWLIYWYIFIALEILELVTFGLIPFWSLIKGGILFINWKPSITEISYKISNIWIKQGLSEIRKIDMVNSIIEQCKEIIRKCMPVVSSYLEQNPTLKLIIWYISNVGGDNDKREF